MAEGVRGEGCICARYSMCARVPVSKWWPSSIPRCTAPVGVLATRPGCPFRARVQRCCCAGPRQVDAGLVPNAPRCACRQTARQTPARSEEIQSWNGARTKESSCVIPEMNSRQCRRGGAPSWAGEGPLEGRPSESRPRPRRPLPPLPVYCPWRAGHEGGWRSAPAKTMIPDEPTIKGPK